ncbi:hypothetical protein FHS43_004026 [Streptosporangium becharense]|uniref:Uncharacterized protein n=1 Tax=Streptosporangium becharense TaxID=1816182 RepID=A0A7W9IGU0_9ACTN|nr:hypothetical protein [Streptosporangium becharense]MBB2912743.1 hypothetical protein [Streptosporangium becharense]MBB5820428.1 hypothetical protein [Streptosporangium becharense]
MGAAWNYVFLDQPVVLTGVAALLIARAWRLRFGRGCGLTAVLAMVWVAVSAGALLSSRGTDGVIPGPAGTGLTMRVEYENWDWFSEWILVVRKDAGLLTREWDVGCSGRRWADIPEVTWTDPARPRLNDRVLVLDPETGRPRGSASSFDFC